MMTEQHGYLVRLVYPSLSQFMFESHYDFSYRQSSSVRIYK
ncbi:hypothetical protein EMIT0P218_20467 [Pseudomonas sp. IT-P218]